MSDIPFWVGALGSVFFGLLWGSFSNVVIYRWPKEESVVFPRSRCGSCSKMISWYDNIPVFSYVLLGGKCRSCKTSFSIRYPMVEALMGVLFGLCFWKFGFSWFLIESWLLVFGLVTISFIDLDHFLIPDVISLPGIVIGLLGATLNPEREFLPSLYGVLVGGGFLWAIAWVYFLVRKQEGLGGGDIKLIAWIGAVLGWSSIPFVILVSSIVGSVVGLALAVKTKDGMKTVIPYGPFLASAALIFMFVGEELSNWYLQFFFPWITE